MRKIYITSSILLLIALLGIGIGLGIARADNSTDLGGLLEQPTLTGETLGDLDLGSQKSVSNVVLAKNAVLKDDLSRLHLDSGLNKVSLSLNSKSVLDGKVLPLLQRRLVNPGLSETNVVSSRGTDVLRLSHRDVVLLSL